MPTDDARGAAGRRVVVVGLGGLGCPALFALARTFALHLVLIDDDVVDEGNLGRQILYGDEDVGESKGVAAARRLVELGVPPTALELVTGRLVPETAREWLRGASVVLEGADNFATKFLCADAGHLEGVPVVHGAALGWQATVWSVSPEGRPCYRCLFEDLPAGVTQNCASAGVIGPVTGIAGALMADAALSILAGSQPWGAILSYDGQADRLRRTEVAARRDCPLCGPEPSIFAVDEARYTRQICAA